MTSLSYIVHKNINDKLTNHNHINNIRSVFCNAQALMSSLSNIVYIMSLLSDIVYKNINDKFTMPNINNKYMYSSFQKYFVYKKFISSQSH